MHQVVLSILAALALVACGGSVPESSEPKTEEMTPSEPSSEPEPSSGSEDVPLNSKGEEAASTDEFLLNSGSQEGRAGSGWTLKPTKTEAALKFAVIDKDKGPIPGIVVALTDPNGRKYYTKETDAEGRAEVLVPNGQKYQAVYVSLGRREIAAAVPVSDEPRQTIRLTLNYKFIPPAEPETNFVLEGVLFDPGKSDIRPDSAAQLDTIVEYMTHKPSSRLEIAGHTDNVGNPRTNKALSKRRAEACKAYVVSRGIAGGRLEAVGYGDERPMTTNDTPEGRQQNRRIEARELH